METDSSFRVHYIDRQGQWSLNVVDKAVLRAMGSIHNFLFAITSVIK
jgi:hypothetical protein